MLNVVLYESTRAPNDSNKVKIKLKEASKRTFTINLSEVVTAYMICESNLHVIFYIKRPTYT